MLMVLLLHSLGLWASKLKRDLLLQVDVRLNSLGDAARGSKVFLDEHTSTMDCVTKDAKRKWETFSEQAENDCKVGSSFTAAKHCRMETMVQEWYDWTACFCFVHFTYPLKLDLSKRNNHFFYLSSACTVDSAVEQWKKSHAAVNDLSKKHVTEVEALIRQVDFFNLPTNILISMPMNLQFAVPEQIKN
jgi:kinesin family member 11